MGRTGSYIYHPKKLELSITSIIQQRLKAVGKCYCIRNFQLNRDNQTFTFYRTYKIRGVRMEDPKEYSGKYTIEIVNDEESKITISV